MAHHSNRRSRDKTMKRALIIAGLNVAGSSILIPAVFYALELYFG